MKQVLAIVVLALLASCGQPDERTELVVQRFFGSCQAEFGKASSVSTMCLPRRRMVMNFTLGSSRARFS